VYDENCTGVQNDLQRASDIARRMVTEFGMSEKLGKSYYSETRTSFLGPQAVGESMHAEQTVREIDLEVRRIIDEAYDTADEILRTRREVLDRLARELLEAEVMDADQLQKIIEEYKAGTGPQLKPGTSTVAKTGDIESDTTAGTAGDSRGGIEIG
ncbi:MAG: cell division protein FtsH, partial [Planctomycetota bacterium]